MVDKGAHHARLELFFEIDYVVWKIQVLRDGFGIVDIIKRATAVLRGAVALKFGEAALIPELHGKADDVAALLLQESGDGGRIDTTGHGYGDEAALSFRALRECVELGGRRHVHNRGPRRGGASAISFYLASAIFR